MDFGDFEEKSADEMKDEKAYREWVDSGCRLKCPNGESIDTFTERTCKAFFNIVNGEIAQSSMRLVIVAHGGSIMAVMNRYAKSECSYFQWYVKNGCGYRAFVDDSTWRDCPGFTKVEKLEELAL